MSKELFPIGVRRDGSYYTRVLWADVTENDPTFWVNNLINDDLERTAARGAQTPKLPQTLFSISSEKHRPSARSQFTRTSVLRSASLRSLQRI